MFLGHISHICFPKETVRIAYTDKNLLGQDPTFSDRGKGIRIQMKTGHRSDLFEE